jgi:glucose-6-phosphate 1-dehydrogenase
MQPVLDAWASEKADFPNYDSGSDGPKATDELPTMTAVEHGDR